MPLPPPLQFSEPVQTTGQTPPHALDLTGQDTFLKVQADAETLLDHVPDWRRARDYDTKDMHALLVRLVRVRPSV